MYAMKEIFSKNTIVDFVMSRLRVKTCLKRLWRNVIAIHNIKSLKTD